MKFPVFSLLTGNFGLPETSSLLTASSSGESSANLIFGGESHRRPRSSQPDSDELFEMASLFPRTTRLPMTVPYGSARAGPDPQNRRRLSPPHPREQGGEASSVRASPLLSKALIIPTFTRPLLP
jgi:hypothetical protein